MRIRHTDHAPDGVALEALLRQATEDPAWRPALYRELLRSQVLALAPEQPIAPNTQGDMVVRFVQWKRIDGQHAIPFFSSARMLYEAIPDGAQCFVLDMTTFLSLTRGALLHLNPFSEFNLEVPAEDIEKLLVDGALSVPERVQAISRRELILREMTHPPVPMIEALTRLYRQLPAVQAAFLAQVEGMYEANQPSLLLGLDVEGDPEPIVRDTSLVMRETYGGPLALDIVRVDDSTRIPRSWFSEALCIFRASWGSATPASQAVQ